MVSTGTAILILVFIISTIVLIFAPIMPISESVCISHYVMTGKCAEYEYVIHHVSILDIIIMNGFFK